MLIIFLKTVSKKSDAFSLFKFLDFYMKLFTCPNPSTMLPKINIRTLLSSYLHLREID